MVGVMDNGCRQFQEEVSSMGFESDRLLPAGRRLTEERGRGFRNQVYRDRRDEASHDRASQESAPVQEGLFIQFFHARVSLFSYFASVTPRGCSKKPSMDIGVAIPVPLSTRNNRRVVETDLPSVTR